MIIIRLWHQKLIPHLPRQQLLGQHRELCALRGKGWGRKHSVVNYVFTHTPAWLVAYHWLVMDEMKRRGYRPDPQWECVNWRGNILGLDTSFVADPDTVEEYYYYASEKGEIIYPEHNDEYLQECLENLKGKGIDLYETLE